MRLNTSVSTTVQSFALYFPTLGQYNAWSCFAGRACTGCWLTHILTSWAGKVGSHNGLCGWRYENILIQHHQYIVKISESCWAEGLSWIALKHDKAPPTGVQCARERDEVPLRRGKQEAIFVCKKANKHIHYWSLKTESSCSFMASDSGSDQYFSLSIISYFWVLPVF